MEEAHRNHKDTTWGWFSILLAVLDGFPSRRSRSTRARQACVGQLATR